MSWREQLRYDPVPCLLGCELENVVYFARRDLLAEDVPEATSPWEMPAPQKISGKQQKDGRWKYPNPKKEVRSAELYDQYETYRQLGYLIEMYGFDRRHQAVGLAKDFLLGYQTPQGDIRGIYWEQYSPNYTAGMIELLTKAGYAKDRQVKKALI